MRQTIDIALPRLHQAQRQIVSEARRFNALCCGRRFGKSTLGVQLLARTALGGKPAACFFPTYRMLAEVWRDLVARLAPITRGKREQEHRLDLLTGGVIEMWSLQEPNVARGRKYARVVIDEAAMIAPLEEAWQAVIRPTLTDYAGDAWFLSTPKGQNYFAALYDKGQQAEGDWQSWRMPSHQNPHLPPSELVALQDELPALVYAQEVLAEIVADGLAVFNPGDLDRADRLPVDTPPMPSMHTLMSVDIGRRRDATVINVFDTRREPFQRVYHERLDRVPYPVIQSTIERVARQYGGRLFIESNGVGDPVIENLMVKAEPFITTARSKAQAIQALQLLLEKGRIAARWTPQERRELIGYAWDDRALQQDCVMSLAIGAYHLVQPPPQPVRRPASFTIETG